MAAVRRRSVGALGHDARLMQLSRSTALLFAVVAGLAVASNYYVQPLLARIASDLDISRGSAGLLVTVSQLGYLGGLVLLVPLGDLLDRRRLVVALMGATSLALAVAAAAPDYKWLTLALAVFGSTSVVAQVLVPLAADLASTDNRGKAVGGVMTGIILGVLLARTVAGAIAEIAGWRTVYALAAVLVAAMSGLLWQRLPVEGSPRHRGYWTLMGSIASLIRRERVLRLSAAYGALTFAAFSVLWSTLALMLSRPPYSYSEGVIGLFGLAAGAGATAASLGGRLFDRGQGRPATGLGLVAGVAGFAFVAAGDRVLWALILGVLLVDFGGQLAQVSNQGAIYQLSDGIRGRLTTAYMSTRFAGGAIGSASGTIVFARGGWHASSALGAALFAVGVLVWLFERRLNRSPHEVTA